MPIDASSTYKSLLSRRKGFLGNDQYTKLLLHCNGADASTSFPDASAKGHTVTAVADAQVDTAQKVFGSASAKFDGTGDYLSVADSVDWYMGTGKFTIDFRLRFSSVLSSIYLFAQTETPGQDTAFCVWNTGGTDNLRFGIKDNSPTNSVDLRGDFVAAINTWYHIAVIRGWGGVTNNWAITLNGTAVVTEMEADDWPNFAAALTIGGRADDACLGGWIEEFRVSKGIARWTANFTPPTIPYR